VLHTPKSNSITLLRPGMSPAGFGQEIAPDKCIPSGTANVISDRIRQIPDGGSHPPLAGTIRRW
jgi:hypothetical protein